MIIGALLLMFAQAEFPDGEVVPARTGEERLRENGFSPEAVRFLLSQPTPDTYPLTMAFMERREKLRSQIARGRARAEQEQALEAEHLAALDWLRAKEDEKLLRGLRGEDRLIFLRNLRRSNSPPPLLLVGAAPSPRQVSSAQAAAYEADWRRTAAADEAALAKLRGASRIAFVRDLRGRLDSNAAGSAPRQ